MEFNITSRAFESGKRIPAEHTCNGDDISPSLRWEGEPGGTVTFALIMEDPDAPGGIFTHWIVYNIPKNSHFLEKITPLNKTLDNGAIQAKNDFGKYGYGGPCPPKGEVHRYQFKIFALSKKLRPESVKNRGEFYDAIEGAVLGSAKYEGVYG